MLNGFFASPGSSATAASQGATTGPPSSAPQAAPTPFNVDMEITKVQAKQFALMAGQAGLMFCVCTVAMCLLRPREKSGGFYVNSDDEEDDDEATGSSGSS